MSDKSIVILGSGMAALGAAHRFHGAGVQTRALRQERLSPVATRPASSMTAGYRLRRRPAYLVLEGSQLPAVDRGQCGRRRTRRCTYVNNYYHGAWVKHPAQANLHNLPTELKTRCILDFIEASQDGTGRKPANYLEWLISVFGETFATHFPAVYGKKYHTVEAEKMSTVWMGPRLYRPSMEEVIRGALFEETPDVHYISNFRYPTEGWLHLLSQAVHGEDRPEARAQGRRHRSRGPDRQLRQRRVRDLRRTGQLDPAAGSRAHGQGRPGPRAGGGRGAGRHDLHHRQCRLARDDFTPATWTYIYDEDIVFTRLSFPHKMSPKTCPPGYRLGSGGMLLFLEIPPLSMRHARRR
jgi:hypothetical protein